MSTNYYWLFEQPTAVEVSLPTDERIVSHPLEFDDHSFHIGKRYGMVGAKTAFIWAIEPYVALKCIATKLRCDPSREIVRDEYGRRLTAEEFLTLMNDNWQWEIHSIGKEFC